MSLALQADDLDEDGYKVRLLLGLLGLGHERRPAGPDPVHGRQPILEDGSGAAAVTLRGAAAILPHLALRFDAGRAWLPADPRLRDQTMAWLLFAAHDLAAAVRARRAAVFDEADDDGVAEAAARRGFRRMDDHMTARGFEEAAWFVGAGPTIADVALFPSFALSRDFGVEHAAYPALRRWMRRLRALPGFCTMPGVPDYH